MKRKDALSWIRDESNPQLRGWEEFYRNRWQHDKVVRSTHGVNCTGGCTWMIYVKDGIVTWELQALDYPSLEPGLPPYEPRGCQRGISFSWYQYSPVRVKYPYLRGVLMDLWRAAKAKFSDPVDAWARSWTIPPLANASSRRAARAAFAAPTGTRCSKLSLRPPFTRSKNTVRTVLSVFHRSRPCPCSVTPRAPPAANAGRCFASFYDWYSDLPSASPETWGEQTDAHECADWYNAKLLAVGRLEPEHDAHSGLSTSPPRRATTAPRCGCFRRISVKCRNTLTSGWRSTPGRMVRGGWP